MRVSLVQNHLYSSPVLRSFQMDAEDSDLLYQELDVEENSSTEANVVHLDNLI